MPDGFQIGKSKENTSIFIDFQRIQVGPGGRPGILITWSNVGKASVAGGSNSLFESPGILITWSNVGKASVAGGRRSINLNDDKQPTWLLTSYQTARLQTGSLIR